MASFKNLVSTTSAQISSGGTITGDLVINGDLQVDGGGSLSFDEIIEGTQVIDVDSTEAFLVRKDGDGGDVLTVDTTNMDVTVNGAKNTTTFSVTNNWSTTNDYIRIALNDATIRSTVLDSGARNLILAPLGNDALALHSTSGGATSVGIGTLTPSTNLHIYSAEDYNPTITIENAHAGSRSPFLSFKKSSSSPANNDKIGQIQFNGNDATGSSRLMAFIEAYTPDVTGGAYDGAFRFSQMINASQTEVMTITGGSVGIGEASPDTMLEIAGAHISAKGLLHLDSTDHSFIALDAHSSSHDSGIYFQENGTTQMIIDHDGSGNMMRFHDGSSTFMALTSGGLLGIGTSSPSEALHISSSEASATPVLLLENTNANNLAPQINLYKNTSDEADGDKAGQIDFEGNDSAGNRTTYSRIITEQYRVLSGAEDGIMDLQVAVDGTLANGIRIRGGTGARVGIGSGATNPSEALEVNGSGANLKVVSDDNVYLSLDSTQTNGDEWQIFNANSGSTSTLQFKNIDQSKVVMLMDETGNVGIGEDSPDVMLHVKDTIDVAYTVDAFTLDANALLKLENSSGTDEAFAAIQFRTGDGADIFIGSKNAAGASNDGSFIVANQSSPDIQFLVLDNNSRISLSNNDSGGTGGRDSTTGNTIFGYSAGNVNSGAVNNTFIGHASGSGSINGGDNNTAIGAETLQALTTASRNQAIGSYSGFSITTGDDNILIGNDVGFAMTGTSDTVLIGHQAGTAINNTGADGTVAVGYQSLNALTSGQRNTAVGFESLKSNTIGDRNTAVGYQALESFVADTDAHGHNTAVGHNAMQGNVTGTDNTAIGNSSAFTGTNNMTAGDDNTFIGSETAPSSATPTNQTVIGKGATGQANNSVTLGNSSVTDVYMAQDSGATVHAGGLDVDNGTGTVNRGNSSGDIFEARGLNASQMKITTSAFTVTPNATFTGSISKGSGSFKIDHPLESKKDTHHLVHSFVEAPQADNIYRGKATLSSGSVEINLDTVSGMSEGTFVLLNTDIQCFTSNESDWDAVKGSVSGNILTISCQNTDSTASVSWLVIGERQDDHMKETNWTDENGKVIVEPEKNN